MGGTPRRVVVIGAGVLGVSAATTFSRAGDAVTVVDTAARPATGVTSLGSGGFRQQFPQAEETQLSAATLRSWQLLEQESGSSLGLRHTGYLMLATGPVKAAALEERAQHLRAFGIEHRLVDGADLQVMMPGLRGADLSAGTPDVGLLTPGDGYTSPPSLTSALARIADRHGATLRFHSRVVDVLSKGNAVTGVRIEPSDGGTGPTVDLPADLVVNAAGLRAPDIGRLVGDHLPVVAWRQHQFRTHDLPGAGPDDFPCVADPGESLYFRPDCAGVLVGYHEDAEAWSEDYTPTSQMAERCVAALARRWPDLAQAGLRRHWVGCYEVTPDWRALVGLSSALDGSAYLCGFSGHGLMNSLGAAEELSRLTRGQQPIVDLQPFAAARFAPA